MSETNNHFKLPKQRVKKNKLLYNLCELVKERSQELLEEIRRPENQKKEAV